MLQRGAPDHLRSATGPEVIAAPLQDRPRRAGIEPIRLRPFVGDLTPRITSRSSLPREKGSNARFNRTHRHDVLDAEWFAPARHAHDVTDIRLKQDTETPPHQPLPIRPPVPDTRKREPRKAAQPNGALQVPCGVVRGRSRPSHETGLAVLHLEDLVETVR